MAISALALPAVPGPIRRNTWLLFLAQVFLSTGLSTSAQLGSLIVFRLSGSAALSGLPTAIYYLILASVGYPAGRLMDRRGRRPGLMLGFAAGGLGAALVAASVAAQSMAGYLAGMVLFSAGVGTGMLTRAAAGDMYPTSLRAGAVGLVITGGLLGGVLGPSLVAVGQRLAVAAGRDPLAVPWAFVVTAFALAVAALSRLRPDPRAIGQRLQEYFPEAEPAAEAIPGAAPVATIIKSRPAQAAIVALACAQATMVMLMATSSLMLSMHGHSTETISIAWMVHVIGMFGLSVPVGRLADRIGRKPVLVGGALITATSGLAFTLGIQSMWVSALAFYLVGVGWCLAFVAGTALLGDLSEAATRARVMGINDLFTSLSAMAAALLSGILLSRGGEITVGVLAAALGSVPLLAILRAGPAAVPAPAPVPAESGD